MQRSWDELTLLFHTTRGFHSFREFPSHIRLEVGWWDKDEVGEFRFFYCCFRYFDSVFSLQMNTDNNQTSNFSIEKCDKIHFMIRSEKNHIWNKWTPFGWINEFTYHISCPQISFSILMNCLISAFFPKQDAHKRIDCFLGTNKCIGKIIYDSEY